MITCLAIFIIHVNFSFAYVRMEFSSMAECKEFAVFVVPFIKAEHKYPVQILTHCNTEGKKI